MNRPVLRPATEPLLKVTPPGYQHLGTIPAVDGGTINVALVCPTVLPAATPKPDAVYAGYTRAELEAAFDRVKPKDHWKNPIDAHIPHADTAEETGEQVKAIAAAVAFYTGSAISTDPDALGVRITADGYYLTIGS